MVYVVESFTNALCLGHVSSCLYTPDGVIETMYSMYGIFTYIWLIFRAHVGKCSIHGAYGESDVTNDFNINDLSGKTSTSLEILRMGMVINELLEGFMYPLCLGWTTILISKPNKNPKT